MQDGRFEVGDIVHLKSGSSRQTVIRTEENGYGQQINVTTAWVQYETQEPYTLTAHPNAFVMSRVQDPMGVNS